MSGTGPRPIVKSGALGSLANYGDLEANPEYLGCTERLPLGALYRDKDFHGSRFSDELSSPLVYLDTAGVGSGVAGLARTSELDQTEALAMPASVSAGVPGDVLVLVDGSPSDYTQLLNYRVNRGGSVFVGSGDRPGGEIFATYSRLLGSGKGSRVLVGRAFLVRNAPTSVGATEVSGGDELMMAITTQVMELGTTPIEAMILLGTNGSSEGYAAADLYRIEGHPIITNHTFYDVDPNTIQLPLGKTIAQITAPSPAPAIPIGAASTVYASDGTRNFWTNAPTVQSLGVIGGLVVGASIGLSGAIIFDPSESSPYIYQADALTPPSLSAPTMIIHGQNVPASTSVVASSGPLNLTSGGVYPASGPDIYGSTGHVFLQSAALGATLTGHTGLIQVETGTNAGTGSTGGLWLTTGVAADGTSGDINIQSGGATIGNAGSVNLTAGVGSVTSGSVNVRFGSGAPSTQYASFTNLNLVLGPVTGSGNYGIHFTGGSTNPTIDQATGASGNGANLLIAAQNGAPGNNSGGDINLQPGGYTGSGGQGSVNIMAWLGSFLYPNAMFSLTSVDLGFTPSTGGSLPYDIIFGETTANPVIKQDDLTTVGYFASSLTIKAQSAVSGSFTNGGSLSLAAGDAFGDISNHHVGGDITLTAGAGFFGNSGRVIIQTNVYSNPTQTLIIFDQSNDLTTLGLGILRFDAPPGNILSPIITQAPSTNTIGNPLTISAQDAIPSGSGDAGGSLVLTTGNPNSGGGTGLIALKLGRTGYDRVEVDEPLGLHVQRNPGGGDTPITIDVSDNDPPASAFGNNQVFVNANGDLKYHSGATETSFTLNGTVARLVDVHGISGSNPVTSSTYVVVVVAPTFTVEAGDIIEGSAHIHISLTASAASSVYVNVHCTDGSSPEDFDVGIPNSSAQEDRWLVIPVYYTATVSGTVTITLQAKALGGGTAAISLFNPLSSSNKWLFLKQTRS